MEFDLDLGDSGILDVRAIRYARYAAEDGSIISGNCSEKSGDKLVCRQKTVEKFLNYK